MDLVELDLACLMLERMIFAPVDKQTRVFGLKTPKINEFSPAYTLSTIGTNIETNFFPPEDIDSPDVVWPLDICTVSWKPVYEIPEYLELFRIRSVDPKYFRGHSTRFSSKMVEMTVAHVRDKSYESYRGGYSYINKKWIESLNTDNSFQETIEQDNSIKMAISIALQKRYSWCVSFGIDDSPKVSFETNANALKKIFKDRDKPAYGDRRAALRHWVQEHWRANSRDEESEIFVRSHLKAKTHFSWRGFNCILEPAQFDLEKNEKLRNERLEAGPITRKK